MRRILRLSARRIRKPKIRGKKARQRMPTMTFRSHFIQNAWILWLEERLLFQPSEMRGKSYFLWLEENTKCFLSFEFIRYIFKRNHFFLKNFLPLHSLSHKRSYTFPEKPNKLRKVIIHYSAQLKIFFHEMKWNHMCSFLFWRNDLQLWHDSASLPNFTAK